MTSVFSALLGLVLLSAQLIFSIYAIFFLAGDMPIIIILGLSLLIVALELSKTIITIFLRHNNQDIQKVVLPLLLMLLSISSIFLMHFTIDKTTSNTQNIEKQEKIDKLENDKKPYYKAIEKGVISKAQPEIDKINKKIEKLENESEGYIGYWSVFVSMVGEIVMIYCFYISNFFREDKEKSLLIKKKLDEKEKIIEQQINTINNIENNAHNNSRNRAFSD